MNGYDIWYFCEEMGEGLKVAATHLFFFWNVWVLGFLCRVMISYLVFFQPSLRFSA